MNRSLARSRHLLPLLAALLGPLALPACVAPLTMPNQPSAGAPANAGTHIAILLPLTGPNAEVGQAMLKAAQLAIDGPRDGQGVPPLDPQDTAGTPEGAAKAAQAALAGGAGIIIGPLTAGETNAVAPIAKTAGVPVLAFTSDGSLAQAGVWPLGITPVQQVRRLMLAVQAENKTRLAAVVPQNIFGEALARGVAATATAASMPEPRVLRVPATAQGFGAGLKTVSDYAARHPAGAPPDTTPPPPPLDALLLGATGDLLGQVAPLLAADDLAPDNIRVLGPATWAREAARQPALAGAWFAAPDPAARTGFEQRYTARFKAPARDFTSIAFDAASIARSAATPAGFQVSALTRPDGYGGVDGLIVLQPDGTVRRGLAIFQVDRGGAHIVQPAPTSASGPGA